jgi:glycosyltransferase involved in cell wall biosynthesis
VVITPVRNEVNYLPLTIESMVAQALRPVQWIIVDDGSSDGTPAIVERFQAVHPWITLVRRADRGHRAPGGGVIEAFYDGYAEVADPQWDFLVKLDGDLSFGPDYFERCLARFAQEPRLGLAGGLVCAQRNGALTIDFVGDPPFHVRGATKIYKRECWDRISPLIKAPGWDTVDELKANLHGWLTWTFPDLKLVQHKPTGSADGNWQNWFKNGRANYITGYHPLFMAVKCLSRAAHKPYVLAAAGLWSGFISGYFASVAQVDDREMIGFLRREQMKRLFGQASIWTEYPSPPQEFITN